MSEDPTTYQTINLAFGALSPSISAQLKAHGLAYDQAAVEAIEADAKAAIRLRVRGLLPDSQFDALARKLMTRINKAVRP